MVKKEQENCTKIDFCPFDTYFSNLGERGKWSKREFLKWISFSPFPLYPRAMPAILFFFLLLLLQIHWGEFPHLLLLLLLFHKRKEFTPRNANSFYSYMHAYNDSPHRKHFFCQSIRISNFLNFTHVGKTGALTIPIVFFGH